MLLHWRDVVRIIISANTPKSITSLTVQANTAQPELEWDRKFQAERGGVIAAHAVMVFVQ